MPFIFNNRAVSHLEKAITDTETELRIPLADFEQFNRYGAGGDAFMFCILRGPIEREIVKVIPDESVYPPDQHLVCERGQGGTVAEDWPAGTLLFLSTTADHYSAIIQRGNERTVGFNPNGALTPNFRGEKVFQNLGCEIRWWQSFDAVSPYWHLIAGLPCGTEEFVNPTGSFISNVWIVASLGEFFYRDVDNTAFFYESCIPFNPSIVLATSGYNPWAISSYSVDGLGNIANVDNDGGFGGAGQDVAVNSTHAVVTIQNQGIAAFAVSAGGAITFTDSDLVGLNDPFGVVWTGAYFVVADDLGGVRSYSLDGGGNLTFVNSAPCNGLPKRIHWDGNFLFVAALNIGGGFFGGIYVYSIDGGGNLTQVDYGTLSPPFGGEDTKDVYSDGSRVYALMGFQGLYIWDVDGGGNITHDVTGGPIGVETYALWKQGDYIILGTKNNGMYSYKDEGSGTPPTQKDLEPNPPLTWPGKMRGDSTFLYVPSRSAFSGLKTYEVV